MATLFSCVVQADISIFPQSGTPFSTVIVQGSGFPAKEPIRIDLGKTTNIAQDLRDSSTSGTFSKSFVIDGQVYGTKVVTVFDLGEAVDRIETTLFFVGPGISVNPIKGVVGSIVTLQGGGFLADEPFG